MDADAAVNAFANSEVDVFEVGPDADAYKRSASVPGGAVRIAAGPDFRNFTLNGTSPMLSNVNVRRAIAMGINREAIGESDLRGLDSPTAPMNNHFFVNSQEGYQDNAGELGTYNPDRSRQLLEAEGWTLAGQFRQKEGKVLALWFVIPAGVQVSKREGELAQTMLQEIGVRLDIQSVPSDDFFDRYIMPGNFDITAFSWLGSAYPISSGRSIYANPKKDETGQLRIQQNFARIGSPAIDELMNQAIAELDQAKARLLLNQADKLIWNEVHSLSLYQRPQIVATKATLANYGAFGFQSTRYEDVGYTR